MKMFRDQLFQEYSYSEPIILDDLKPEMYQMTKATLKTNLSRLVSSGVLKKDDSFSGVYYFYRHDDLFDVEVAPMKNLRWYRKYVANKAQTRATGFETGMNFINKLGLTTQMPELPSFATTIKSKKLDQASQVGMVFKVVSMKLNSVEEANFIQVIDYLAEFGKNYQVPSESSMLQTDEALITQASQIPKAKRKILLAEYIANVPAAKSKNILESELIYDIV